MKILISILVFGVIIAIHEFGHFSVAKLCGIKVNQFAIGMGPPIFKKQWGETEYSLRVLPIGGLKEKSLAAFRAGITDIIIPNENKADIDDVPKEVRSKINFIPVKSMDTVLENALR